MSQEAGTSERNVGGMGHIRNASRRRDVMVTRISHPLAN
jgi:hypothetical protein